MSRRISVIATAIIGIAVGSSFALTSNASADDLYAGFPITVKGYSGSKTNSVSYTGQIARHTLSDTLKKLAGLGVERASADPTLKAQMMSYFAGKDSGRSILSPKTKGPVIVSQTNVDDISKGKNLAGKIFKGAIPGMPNNLSGKELVEFWIHKASMANKGVDIANGYNYPQLISKFIMGAVFYNQVVDNYLDENLSAEKKPNDKPYKEGAPYTGKEHSWDEAFGYFGAPAHSLMLSPQELYEIAKLGGKSEPAENALMYGDFNKDGSLDLKTEMVFGPAYYAAAFDKGGTSYGKTIVRAFLDGRSLLADAKGEKLSDSQRSSLRDLATIIATNWEKIYAEAVFKYAGSVYKDMMALQTIIEANGDTAKAYSNYIKHWGELKGFSLALQTGKNNLGETAIKLNRLIGAGPLLINLSQVTDIDKQGNYVRDQGPAWGEYMLHMLKVQAVVIDKFSIKGRNNDMTGELATLSEMLGSGSSAEND